MIQLIKRHKGLGDTVEFLAEKTGIKYAVNKAVELGIIEDCGCEERQRLLNELVPYGNKGENSEVLRSES
jgi:hypothetical protein